MTRMTLSGSTLHPRRPKDMFFGMKTACLSDNEREAFKMKESAWSFTVLGVGQANHLRNCCAPFAAALSSELANHEGIPARHLENDSPLGFARRAQPRAALSGMEAMVGVLLFVLGWGAKRVLDDVYEVKVRPHIRKLLGENVTPSVRPAIVVVAIWHERLQKGAIIAFGGDSLDGRSASEAKVSSIHLKAERLLELDQSGKPLVLFGVHNGLLVQGPLFFESLPQVYQHLSASDAIDVESRILDDPKQ